MGKLKADKKAVETAHQSAIEGGFVTQPSAMVFKDGDAWMQPLDDSAPIAMSREAVEGGDDVIVAFEVWAPGKTEGETTERKKADLLRTLKVRVDGPLVRKGGVTLRYGGQAGTQDHDCFVYWALSMPVNKTGKKTATGTYPVRFTVGGTTIGKLQLAWAA